MGLTRLPYVAIVYAFLLPLIAAEFLLGYVLHY